MQKPQEIRHFVKRAVQNPVQSLQISGDSSKGVTETVTSSDHDEVLDQHNKN